jgi:hypothetical protein
VFPVREAGKPVLAAPCADELADDRRIDCRRAHRHDTTVSERWTLKLFADGSEQLHVVRTFVPDDPRLPIEKDAGTSFTTPDGERTVAGKPLQLIGPDGGVRLLGAGLTVFGEDVVVHGRNVLDADLADYYCPSS